MNHADLQDLVLISVGLIQHQVLSPENKEQKIPKHLSM